jgi:hypothetical protein
MDPKMNASFSFVEVWKWSFTLWFSGVSFVFVYGRTENAPLECIQESGTGVDV